MVCKSLTVLGFPMTEGMVTLGCVGFVIRVDNPIENPEEGLQIIEMVMERKCALRPLTLQNDNGLEDSCPLW